MSYFIHPAEARRRFTEYAAGEISGENLAHGALLVALEEYPQLDVETALHALDQIAERVGRRSSVGDPAIFRLGHLHSELFDVDHYRGDTESYYDPRNAYLNEVIERKLGIPITLSIVFLHVAQRCGLNALGVGLPGHYLVKVQFELNEIYIDPFHGGATLTLPEIAARLSEVSAGQVQLSGEHLRSWSERRTLIRLLANLHNMWSRLGEAKKAAAAQERIEILESSGT